MPAWAALRVRRAAIRLAVALTVLAALRAKTLTLPLATSAYATFANGGNAVTAHVVERVRTPAGKVLYARKAQDLGRIVEPRTIAMMNAMMRETIVSGTARNAQLPNWPAAGKTGTSQDFRDAWFLGYTANLTAGVWIGNDSNASMKRVFGGTLPATIWAKFMTKAHEGVPVAQLPGTDIAPFLASAPAPSAEGGFGVADAGPSDQDRNELQMRQWILDGDAEATAPPPEPVQRKRGFFTRLFGR